MGVVARADASAPSEGESTARSAGFSQIMGAFATPTAVGRYRVLREVGRGALGIVFLAYDPQLDRRIALKVLEHSGNDDAERRRSSLREAQAVARVPHPNVVHVYDVGELDSGGSYIAMEYVPGPTFAEWLREHRDAPNKTKLDLLRQAGRGLAAAHGSGITHRDFKPANVIVGEDDRVRVLDFGLARTQAGVEGSLTGPASGSGDETETTVFGNYVGTPAYMAPEQSEGQAITPAADQFAFCVTVWEALTGVRPFPVDKRLRIVAVREGRVQGREKASGLSRRVRRALLRGMSYEPAERFENIEALLRELGDRRGRRLALAGLTGAWVIGGLAFAVGRVEGEPAAAQCDAADLLDEVWGDGPREAALEGLRKTGLSYADDVAQRVDAHVHRWSQRWSAVYESTCEAARQRQDLSAEQLDVVHACLLEGRRRLGARATLLAEADGKTVASAMRLVGGLGAPEDCADPQGEAQRRTRDLEADPAAKALYRRIDDTEARMSAGRYGGALEALVSAYEDATAASYEGLAAQASAALGTAYRWQGQHEAGQEAYENAVGHAIRSGRERLAADASVAFAYGEHYEGDLEHADHWLRLARAFAARTPGMVARQIRMDIADAEFLLSAGKTSEALAAAERAVAHEVTEEDERSAHTQHQLALAIVGRVLHKMQRPEDAVAQARAAAEGAAALHGKSHPQYAKMIEYVAVFSLDAGRPNEALALLEEAASIRRAAKIEETPLYQALEATNRGSAMLQLGRGADAVREVGMAQALYDAGDLPRNEVLAYVLGNIGLAHQAVADRARAKKYLKESVKLFDESPAQKPGDAVGYRLGVAVLLMEEGDLEAAKEWIDHDRAVVPQRSRLMFDAVEAMYLGASGDPDAARERLEALWPKARATKAAVWMYRVSEWSNRELGTNLVPPVPKG